MLLIKSFCTAFKGGVAILQTPHCLDKNGTVSSLEGRCCRLGLRGLGTVSGLEGRCYVLGFRGLGTVSGLEGRCCRLGLRGLGTVSGLEGRCCWVFVICFGNTEHKMVW